MIVWYLGAISKDGCSQLQFGIVLWVDDVIRSHGGRGEEPSSETIPHGFEASFPPLHRCPWASCWQVKWGEWEYNPPRDARRMKESLTLASIGSMWGVIPKPLRIGTRYIHRKYFCCKHLCLKHFLCKHFHCTMNWPYGNFTAKDKIPGSVYMWQMMALS